MLDVGEFQTAGAATLKPREAKLVGTRGTDNRLVFRVCLGQVVILKRCLEIFQCSLNNIFVQFVTANRTGHALSVSTANQHRYELLWAYIHTSLTSIYLVTLDL